MSKVKVIIAVIILLIIACLCCAWIFAPTDFSVTVKFEDKTINAINNLAETIKQAPTEFNIEASGLDEISSKVEKLTTTLEGLE